MKQDYFKIKYNWAVPLLLCLLYLTVNVISSFTVVGIAKLFSSEEIIYIALNANSFFGKVDLFITLLIIYKFFIPFDKDSFSFTLSKKTVILSILCAISFIIFNSSILYIFFDTVPKKVEYIYGYVKILDLIGVCLLAPILEEFFYRGVIFSSLSKHYSFIISALYSSLIFSLFHLSIQNFIPTFLLGMTLAWVFTKTHNIIYCIIIHMTYNITTMYLFHL